MVNKFWFCQLSSIRLFICLSIWCFIIIIIFFFWSSHHFCLKFKKREKRYQSEGEREREKTMINVSFSVLLQKKKKYPFLFLSLVLSVPSFSNSTIFVDDLVCWSEIIEHTRGDSLKGIVKKRFHLLENHLSICFVFFFFFDFFSFRS